MVSTRALFRVNFDVCQRSRGGNAVKLAAYNACGRMQHGEQVFDFRRKRREHVGTTLLLLPADAPANRFRNPGDLWRAAEAAERRGDAQSARQILLTVPRECPPHFRTALVRHVVQPWVDAGMAAQIDLHDPSARDGGEQPHAHVLLSMREMDADGFAPTKTLGRAWNQTFRANGGRDMRAQVADRMNSFMEANGITARVDHRTNHEVDGPDALPPEPTIPRSAVEVAKRNPSAPPAAVVALDDYRRDRARLHEFEQRIAAASARADDMRRRINTAQERTTTMKDNTPWTKAQGQLSPEQQQAARASYERWRDTQLRRGRDETKILPFDSYVQFVQDRQDTKQRGPLPSQNRDVAFARQTRRDHEPGFSRRQRFLANLLAEHYAVEDLDPAIAANILRVRLDRDARTATVHLCDGSSFVDHGDRIEFRGTISQPSAGEIAAAASRHGWTQVALTGSNEFRDETAIALALREPPIVHDHELSPAAAERLAAALAARAPAGISPVLPETEHAHNSNSIAPVAGAAVRPGPSARSGDGPGAGRDGVGVLALAGDGSAGAGDAGSGGAGDDGGLADATDDEILPPLLRWLEPRVQTARDHLASRPTGGVGGGKAAARQRERQADFDAEDATARAHATVAVDFALRGDTPPADIISAVRQSGDPAEAVREMARQMERERRQKYQPAADEYEPAEEQFERPRI